MAVVHPRGGSARVGVWGMPDPSAPTLAGAAVRALVLPQLFTVAADGRRLPSLVVPGSDRDGGGGLSASFVLRPGATWSNGAPITVEDLRRTADARWVAGLEGPDPSGRITVRFTQPMPGWRRLWSDTASITAPAPDVWGGPFVVAAITPGLEAVLHRNEKWWGGPAPWLDEVRLVLVPDATTMRQLFERGELDVIAPPASTNRTALLGQAAHRGAGLVGRGAWDVRLVLNPKRLDDGSRRAIAGLVDWDAFAGTLLRGEASAAGGSALGDAAALAVLEGKTVQVSGEIEEPMTGTLERAMQKRAASAGGALELRNAESDRVEGWLATGDYDAAVVMAYEPPEGCLSCRDAGEVVSLWRPDPVVAWRGVEGVEVNGWALSPAWDAASWWRPAGTS
ncbi:MAG: peptide/nickel transport system substrate-binding protein [Acidimicrobiaceae bacterium]|nr:peptide/nickel transport system substrate-binding protein [Acidimicrobiaceae bacterium]